MKKLFLFLLLLAMLSVYSQNWSPINSTEKFCYSSDDDLEIINNVLWVDTIVQLIDKEIYHFNKIAREIENQDFSYLYNEPQFLLDKAIVYENGIWEFIDTSFSDLDIFSSFKIMPHAHLYDSWEFTEDITAAIANESTAVVLGETDSVKTILLSDATTITLSKNHGIINWKNQYELVGIEGRDLGIQVPDFDDMFSSISAGDVVCIYHNSWMTDGNFYRVEYKKRYDIDDVYRYEDSIVMLIYAIIKKNHFTPNGNTSTTTSGQQTLVFKRNKYTEVYPKEVLSVNLNLGYAWGGGLAISKLERFKWGGLMKTQIKHEGDFGYSNLYFECAGEYNHELCADLVEDATIERSVNYGFAEYSNYGYEWGGEQFIRGIIDDGDTLGLIYDWEPVGNVEIPMHQLNFVYPNPTKDFIIVQIPILQNQVDYKIYNINGILIKEGELNQKESRISVKELPKGMYFIELYINGEKSTKKWIKN